MSIKGFIVNGQTQKYDYNELDNKLVIDSSLSTTSTNPVQNKIVKSALDGKITAPATPSTGSFLVWNGSAWVAQTLSTWQGGSY